MPIRCVVCGATGRMGSTVIKLIESEENFELIGAVERRDHPDLAVDVGYLLFGRNNSVCLENDLRDVVAGADVVIDFTEPDASLFHAEVCADKKVAYACGTTGFTDEQWKRFLAMASRTRTVYAPNFSVGVLVLSKLVQLAASSLSDWDVEIVEVHHGKKLDAPSGTAKKLAQVVAEARRDVGEHRLVFGREGRGSERGRAELGVHAVRGGDVFGEHTAYFLGPAERLELTHRASSREAFARGALAAAEFIVGTEAAAVYSMEHVVEAALPPLAEEIPVLAGLEPSKKERGG